MAQFSVTGSPLPWENSQAPSLKGGKEKPAPTKPGGSGWGFVTLQGLGDEAGPLHNSEGGESFQGICHFLTTKHQTPTKSIRPVPEEELVRGRFLP